MRRKNFWTPLFSPLRRRFPSISPNSSLNISPPNILPYRCSSTTQYGASWSTSNDILGNLKFSRKLCTLQSAEQVPVRCWNCKASAQTMPFLVCDSCRSVQPVDPSVDYFQIFGLEKKYELEDANLEGKYKDWQKKLHPDLVHSKSELKLEGVHVDEEQTISDISFLAEIMEMREAVEEAATSEALLQIQSQAQEKLKHWSQSFSNAFQNWKFEEAVTSIQRMTYYTRVNDEIMKKL